MSKQREFALGATMGVLGVGVALYLWHKEKKRAAVYTALAGCGAGIGVLAVAEYCRRNKEKQSFGKIKATKLSGAWSSGADGEILREYLHKSNNKGDRFVGTVWDAYEGDEEAKRELDKIEEKFKYKITDLSDEIARKFSRGYRVAKQYMSDYGCYIAIALYATGHAEIAVAVDGIILVFDATDIVNEYRQTGDLKKYLFSLGNILLSAYEGNKVGKIIDSLKLPMQSTFYQQSLDAINEAQGSIFGLFTDFVINYAS